MLAGCASAPATPTPSPEVTQDPSASCVADPGATAAFRWPDAAYGELDGELVERLQGAAEVGLALSLAPGVTVGVRTSEGTWMGAFGVADLQTGAPMEVGMHTRVGSVTKTFTGTLFLQLVEEGKLHLDDTVDQWFPEFPNSDRVTLQQLSDMHSGLTSYTTSDEFEEQLFGDRRKAWTVQELLDLAVVLPPSFEPGTDYQYSNTNTVLLGEIISRVEGKDLGQLLQERIFDPLELRNTSWPGESNELPEPFAHGITLQGVDDAVPLDVTFDNPSWGNAAGEIISDLPDLLTWTSALATGQGVLDEATAAERLASFPGPYRFSYGIGAACFQGWVGHEGELPGYNTTVYYDTVNNVAVAVQTNSDVPSGQCTASETLADDPHDQPCTSPASRVFIEISKALGREWIPNDKN